MLARIICLVCLGILASTRARAADQGEPEPMDPGEVLARVQGDVEVEERPQPDGATFFYAGVHRVATPLPEGYPRPTPPGAIEVKKYPAVRRATYSGKGKGPNGMKNSAIGFWPLFAHIKTRGIAMTAPVEIEYKGLEAGEEARRWSMSFLYRSQDLGPEGSYGSIAVEDAEPVTVFAVGLAGDATREKVDEALRELEQAIEDSKEWRRDGEPRVLGYNGPDVRQKDRWSEVQIPVIAVESEL